MGVYRPCRAKGITANPQHGSIAGFQYPRRVRKDIRTPLKDEADHAQATRHLIDLPPIMGDRFQDCLATRRHRAPRLQALDHARTHGRRRHQARCRPSAFPGARHIRVVRRLDLGPHRIIRKPARKGIVEGIDRGIRHTGQGSERLAGPRHRSRHPVGNARRDVKHLTGIRRDHQLISRTEGIRHGIWHDGDPVPSIQEGKSARDRGDTSRIIDADGEWIVHGT